MNLNNSVLSVIDEDGNKYEIGAVHNVRYAIYDQQHENGRTIVSGWAEGIKAEFKFKMSTREMLRMAKAFGAVEMVGKLRKRLRYERMMERIRSHVCK